MEEDSCHSLIERKLKYKEIYLPTDYVRVCREAINSQPFIDQYLTYQYLQFPILISTVQFVLV